MTRLLVRRMHDAADEYRYRSAGYWTGRSLYELVDRWAEETGNKTAVDDGVKKYTYRQLRTDSSRAAAVLSDLGVHAGDVVAAFLPNTAFLPMIHLAANRIGAIFLPMPSLWSATEVVHAVAAARPGIIVIQDDDTGAEASSIAARAMSQNGRATRILTLTDLEQRIRGMAADPTRVPGYRDHGRRVALVISSSGSTGLPKLSALSDDNLHAHLLSQMVPAYGLSSGDVMGAIAPVSTGSTGYLHGVLSQLLIGATSYILPVWSAALALQLLVDKSCTIATAIPTQLIMMLTQLEPIADTATSALHTVIAAGAPLPEPVALRAERQLGCRVYQLYGASEAGLPTLITGEDAAEKRRTTVGRVARGQELRIIDGHGSDLPHSTPGEVIWRGPGNSYGFFNQPKMDVQSWDEDGWFRSGDLGEVDEEGYLRIVGRLKDMILRGGLNIFPLELETILYEHPAITEIAVVGVPDERLGERTCAVVVPAQTAEPPSLEDLAKYLHGRGIAQYKLPEYLIVVDALPRASSSKLDKSRIQQIAASALAD